ncbi:MAG: prepilin-type N-terminal cleavage/methylation domain-containing protein [Planctomycetota bacterium]
MKRPGFTLIELLIVIGVIALALAVSIPALWSSKQRAKTVLCGSNVKQLAMGLFMYETENETFPYGFTHSPFVPPPGGYPGDPRRDRRGWWWFHCMKWYNVTDNSIFRCPSKSLTHPSFKNEILYSNYGVNRSICKVDEQPLPGSRDMPHPEQTLLIVDSGYSIIGWWHATDVPPVPLGPGAEDAAYIPGLKINSDKSLLPEQKRDAIDGRHPGKTVNVGFADGHAGREKAEDLFVEKLDDGYMNRTPLWLPK